MGDFKLLGVDELDKYLKGFSRGKVRNIIKAGLQIAAENTAEAARDLAPVKSGETKEAIKVEVLRRNKKYFGFAIEIGEGDYKGNEFYAAFVEIGHHVGYRHSSNFAKILGKLVDRRHWLEGKHWLKQAFDSTANTNRDIAIGYIKRAIEKEDKRLTRKAVREMTQQMLLGDL